MAYGIFLSPAAARQLKKLSGDTRKKILLEIELLTLSPRPVGYTKLKGRNEYRIRTASYRIIYEVHDERLLIKVLKIAHRSKAYKR